MNLERCPRRYALARKGQVPRVSGTTGTAQDLNAQRRAKRRQPKKRIPLHKIRGRDPRTGLLEKA